jgi:EAL domain-containing protein (putative c-di-GMP-specific phosphodiesterase class I)
MTIEDRVVEVDVSIGIALSREDGNDADALYRHADHAMYEAKRGRAGYSVYEAGLEQATPNDVIVARELRQALQRGELNIVYQPEIDLHSGQLVRVEALLRWQHPQRGLLLPDEFIPTAERTRVMAQVTRWVLSTVIRQLRTWADTGWRVQASVNLSAWDLRDSSLPDFIDGLLRRWQVDAASLAIETTETVLMADPVRARETMNNLQALGIMLSLDDFGTGYSALSFIRDLPSQEIKIDQSFVRNLERDRNNAAIVGALIHLAHALGRSTVAEGVETQEAYNMLRNLGCDIGQGHLMAHPMSPGDLEEWVHTRAVELEAKAATWLNVERAV